MADINKAKKRMDKIVVNWFVQEPMLLGVWSLVEKYADKGTRTIGIDTRSSPPCINYNPNFINSLNDEVLEHVLANQCFKLLLRHPTTRFKKPKEVSSLASDVTVNQMAMRNMPNIDGIFDVIPMPEKYNLEKGSFYENYFRKMMDNLEDTTEDIEKQFGKKQEKSLDDLKNKKKSPKAPKSEKGDKKGDEGEQSDSGQPQDGDGEPGDGQGESSDGSGEGQPQEGQGSGGGGINAELEDVSNGKDEDGFPEIENQKEGIKEMMDPRSETNKNWGENDVLDAEVENMVNERKGSSKMWGKFTADFMGEIVAANTPKISFKEIIRRFNTSITTTNTIASRKKANRRFDLDAPGRRRIYTTKVIFSVDVSGSMSDDDLAEGFAVINSVCKNAEVEYVLFDTEIKLIEKKMKKAKKSFKVVGRGGTDFDMICRYAEKQKADGLIIYTDGYAPAPKPPKGMKVLWLMNGKGNKPPVDWGYCATLDRTER